MKKRENQESQLPVDQEILSFWKRGKRRIRMTMAAEKLLISLTIGLAVGSMVLVAAFFVPIYEEVLWAGATFGIIAVGVFAVLCARLPKQKELALLLDRHGLQERLTTSLELLGDETPLSMMQKQSTVNKLVDYELKEKFPWKIPPKKLLVFAMVLSIFVILPVIPAPTKEQAIKNHGLQLAKEEEINKVEEVLEEVKQLSDKLPEELKTYEDVLNEAKKELEEAFDEKEINKAMERLETKLEKELQKEEDAKTKSELASAMNSLVDENKLQSAQNELNQAQQMQQMIAQMQTMMEELFGEEELSQEQLDELLSQELSEEELEQLQELMEQLQQMQLTQALASTLAASNAALSANQLTAEQLSQLLQSLEQAGGQLASSQNPSDSSSQGQGNQPGASGNGQSGSGSGQGQGAGQGSGTGAGAGQGSGSGQGGTGYNYGSSNGIEKVNDNPATSELVAIGDRVLGGDDSLSGTNSGNGDSDYMGNVNGAGFTGNMVDYGSVISEYTNQAVSKIENNQVPDKMKDVVKAYFEGLGQ